MQCDIGQLLAAEAAAGGQPRRRLWAHTVVMNPPFGTRRKGADVDFLRAAFAISCNSVYSLHKSSTRDHLLRVAERWVHPPRARVRWWCLTTGSCCTRSMCVPLMLVRRRF